MDSASVLFFTTFFAYMQGRRGENDDVTALWALGRWAVGPSVNISFPEHISESTCQILHTTPLGGLVVPFGVYEL